MEVNLVLLVSNILSISALILACIIWLPNIENIEYDPFIDYEIPVQDYVEVLTSSRNAKDFNRKMKKYIKCKNK